VELKRTGICRAREFDIERVKAHVLYQIFHDLLDYFVDRTGTIYWRIPPEEEFGDSPQPRFSEEGPDIDPMTDKRCFMDRDWKYYRIRMRLLMSDKPEIYHEDGPSLKLMVVMANGI